VVPGDRNWEIETEAMNLASFLHFLGRTASRGALATQSRGPLAISQSPHGLFIKKFLCLFLLALVIVFFFFFPQISPKSPTSPDFALYQISPTGL